MKRHSAQTLFRLACAALLVSLDIYPPAPVGAQQATTAAGERNTGGTVDRTEAGRFQAVVAQYCVSCHNTRLKTGGLALDAMNYGDIPSQGDVWEKVIRKVNVGMMPPSGAPRPTEAVRTELVSWLETTLDRAALANPTPGTKVLHRLNRAEYANAIRDLLALEVDPSALLPVDDSAYGFDNVADVLGVSPVLVERYLSASHKISAMAVGDPETAPGVEVFRVSPDASQDTHIEGLPIGTMGGIRATFTLAAAGDYLIGVKFLREFGNDVRGLEDEHTLEYSVDGERVGMVPVGGDKDFGDNRPQAADEIDKRTQLRLSLSAGPHVITAAFLERTSIRPTRLQLPVRSAADSRYRFGYPHVERLTVSGPFSTTALGDTPSRSRVFVCRPMANADEVPCARRILTTLARRAYRGDVTETDTDSLLDAYAVGRARGSFDKGIQLGLQRILASPKFTFRVESDPAGAKPDSAYRLTDLELASRLSFFLWSSIPDEELLDVARRQRLHLPSVLTQQVRRMLADPKSQALVTNFAGQWLYLRNLKTMTPHSYNFADFDDNLRQAFIRETSLFFESVLREDRNVQDLMTADYTFLNERLAKHYRIPNVYGSHFRRVTLAEDARRGLLGKGAILMASSHTDRTSPVVRGKWVLDNILAAPPPPPPADIVIPPLDEKGEREGKVLTMRERMEEHRKNPVCASCHRIMDPIGLALENFDAVGAWRTRDGGTSGPPIDPSGVLLDGTKVDGVVGLRQALMRKPEQFVGTLTEKLMTYALGRGLSHHDMPAVRTIVKQSRTSNYRFSSVILGIVESSPFTMRLATAEIPTPSSARVASHAR
jgi:mono/diheme cytochrome c family protein